VPLHLVLGTWSRRNRFTCPAARDRLEGKLRHFRFAGIAVPASRCRANSNGDVRVTGVDAN
jgi:hypothetical protein